MGNDVSLTAWSGDPTSESPGEKTYIGCDSTERVGLFWLCCFRLEDLKTSSDRYFESNPCCRLEAGLRQFHEGIKILLETFPLTEKDNPSFLFLVGKFVAELERSGARYLQLQTWQCDDRSAFCHLFLHALEGFRDPNVLKHYTASDRMHWEVDYAMPAESGVMNWAGSLRRLVSSGYRIPVEQYDVESADLFPGSIAADSLGRATNGCYVDEEFVFDEELFND